jgi:catechol 2,3-dioxygenase-like lactoylglutathione lyase family enzyme
MHVTRLGHTGLTIARMERSLAFYGGILGFEVVSRRVIDAPWLAQLLGLDAAMVDAADLTVPGTDQVVQLFAFETPSVAPVSPAMPAPGSVHLAFVVDGLSSFLDRFAEAGVPLLASPVVITTGANTGGRLVCVLDPDGIVVELFEAPAVPA